jgi:hypothetical protein
MTKLKKCAKGGVFIVPSNLAIFWRFRKFCFARNIGAFRKFWFARNYLCPPMGYLLSPPTRPSNSAVFGDFRKFCFAPNFCALCFRVFIVPSNSPLKLGNFLEIFGIFVSLVIFCALQFCGVTCVLHAALAACVCCSILSISWMMCGVRNSLRMFW